MFITLGFSPCPNDTFIFDALVNNKIDTQGIQFIPQLQDVQALNDMAIKNTLDITKLSYGVLPLVLDKYMVLNSGSALGSGVGPLLIARNLYSTHEIEDCVVAIPGINTTAHLLFKLAFPNVKNKIFVRYDEIESFILNNHDEKRAGVIIHENRFTYSEKGLKKIIDLGEYWEEQTDSPIPLGGIVAKRSLDLMLIKKIDALIKESIQNAFKNYPELSDYIKVNAQEMSEDVMRKHIDLYVNNFSIDLGNAGRSSVKKLLSVYNNSAVFNSSSIFLT